LLADELLPIYDVSDSVAVVVEAGSSPIWDALVQVDLIEVGRRRPLIGALGGLRALPEIVAHLVHGERPPGAPERLTLREMTVAAPDEGGWTLLGERPGEEIALGLIGKFWRPVIEYATVDAEEFATFAEPGYAKTLYVLSVAPLGEGRCLLAGTMRTACTDEHARRWFRRYWALGVGSGAHILVQGLLEVVREDAEGVSPAIA
jgi:hypothetical protein